MTLKITQAQLSQAVRWGLKTHHGRMVSIGLLAGLIYLPTWISVLARGVFAGSSTIILNLGFLYLGLSTFWQQRGRLKGPAVLGDDRLIGHALILSGAIMLVFSRDSVSLQSALWMLILIGIAWSSFTPIVFGRFPLASAMVLLSMYPDYVWLSNRVWRALTGPYFLENVMAQWGSMALNAVGQSAQANERFLSMAGETVEVASGCTGFDMAFVLFGVSIVWGLFINQSWHRIGMVCLIGVAIAMVFNIPRIMLLAFAAIYWGQESFDFWHGMWGGQIFSAIMFTAYYYAAMAVFNGKTKKSAA